MTETHTPTGPPDPPAPGSGAGSRARGARIGTGRRADRGARGARSARRTPGAPRRTPVGSRWAPYALVAPFFLFFGAFGVFPLVATAWTSLHRVELTAPAEAEWVGLHNYARLLDDAFFWNALVNTVVIGVLSTVPQLLLALGVAHLLDVRLRGRGLFRVVALAPFATSVAAATLVFALFYGRDNGMANWALGVVGLAPVDWQNGPWASKLAVSSIVVWRWTGYNALIYLAAMQTVPRELYEAAALDGASRWRQFLHVTLPGLRPAILFTVLVSTIGATQLFGEPLLFGSGAGASGGADHQFQTLGLYLYEQGWVNLHLGRAAAIAWAMLVILVVLFGAARLVRGALARRGLPARARRERAS
ncbi:Cellobiose ABC transporter permease protein [Streptomyces venezuelae]|uniref:carbohydrate ABC transporter permease n=1 Tax=Streptomyces gardneri TaxID=66892 RepID=UPI0006BC9748|nr:sugar ABC transporter permease [Streptomyces gardneri]ALO08608.1 Cellobiose ABC transporter permease protein [Streptomyces venezuelae]WRK37156.1 sugar ABC transporter permease [Streptomyces venezuelae]CUM41018.1 putative cellobiose transport permease [Streptomyces venezuelae]